ncbi:SirB2 family protein [Proteobacteria bacterium 005FR1]|nr:SirB2 family protein [Proteobacteria bacterium 005FR1]
MLEYYPEIRSIHIAAVVVSGSLFAVRGLGLIIGKRWPLSPPLRYLSYTIDTILLTAALLLMTIVRQYPLVHGWLTVKVGLLVLYIALGIMAFRPGPGAGVRFGLWTAALLVYAFIISVAMSHHPLGYFAA